MLMKILNKNEKHNTLAFKYSELHKECVQFNL